MNNPLGRQENNMEDPTIQPIGLGLDPQGILYNYDGRLIRGITAGKESIYRELLDKKVIQELISEGKLIPAQLSDIKLPGHQMAIEHPVLPFVTYPFEWSVGMFKDAALLIYEVVERLLEENLCLQDGLLWNVVFKRGAPIFVDFTSIVPLTDCSMGYFMGEFIANSLNTLTMIQRGHVATIRSLSRDYLYRPDSALSLSCCTRLGTNGRRLSREMLNIFRPPMEMIQIRASNFIERASIKLHPNSHIQRFKKLGQKIKSLQISPESGAWTNYFQGKNDLPSFKGTKESLDQILAADEKPRRVVQMIDQLNPSSFLDLGCNRGVYSLYAGLRGAEAIGIETDEAALEMMYQDSKKMSAGALPIFANVVCPARANGSIEREWPVLQERIQAELTACLALTHHLLLGRPTVSLPQMAKILAGYSPKKLLVEFVDRDDKHVQALYPNPPEWYSIETFKSHLSAYFPSISEFSSSPKTRSLLLCERSL